MARYSRIRGPASVVDLASTLTLISGFSITRTFGLGLVLVSYSTSLFNNTGASTFWLMSVVLDGVAILNSQQRVNAGVPHGHNISWTDIFEIACGRHTFELHGRGSVAAGNEINLEQTNLLVIELPPWDQEEGLITL